MLLNKCNYCLENVRTFPLQFFPKRESINICLDCLPKAVKEEKKRNKTTHPFVYPVNFFLHKKIPLDFLNANIWNVKEDQKYMLVIWNMLKKKGFGKGVIFRGEVGIGKTYLLYAFLKDICMFKPHYETLLINETELFRYLKEQMNNNTYATSIITKIEDADMIFYDDLGSQIKTISGEWGRNILYEIINKCSDLNKILIISSNIEKENFEEIYGIRTADRLRALHYVNNENNDSLRKPRFE